MVFPIRVLNKLIGLAREVTALMFVILERFRVFVDVELETIAVQLVLNLGNDWTSRP